MRRVGDGVSFILQGCDMWDIRVMVMSNLKSTNPLHDPEEVVVATEEDMQTHLDVIVVLV